METPIIQGVSRRETTTAKYCHYLRVSTAKQGIDGYGIEAQRAAIAKYTPAIGFVEVESGKRKDRPELLKALAYCKKEKAVLVVAKLDRLACKGECMNRAGVQERPGQGIGVR
jgi:DNA invertase Pin-like site-specific DNA recombinase